MKRCIVTLVCAVAVSCEMLGATATNDIHIAGIEKAIAGLNVVLSNSVDTFHYDFEAILEELKLVKDTNEKLRLLKLSLLPLFVTDGEQWRRKERGNIVRLRESMVDEAFALVNGDGGVLLHYEYRVKVLQIMKRELSFYDGARDPDDVRRELWPKIEKDFKQDVERCRARSNEKVFLINESVKLPQEYYDARARWSYKKWLVAHIKDYEKNYFDSKYMKAIYMDLQPNMRPALLEMAHKAIGRYPDWYLDEKKKPGKNRPATTSQ